MLAIESVNDYDHQAPLEIIDHNDDSPTEASTSNKDYEYILKFLLVGDSDVGKEEILNNLTDDVDESTENYRSLDVAYKSTSILLYGKRVKLHAWNTSGQGRFSTVFYSYSRGAQGIILVYDITNKWSFKGLDRWLREIDKHAPGVPKILVGNRKHLAFRRQVSEKQAVNYANKHNMSFLEVSPLCNFNVQESCAELSRLVLERNGMKTFLTNNTMSTLQNLCYQSIISRVNAYDIENLPLPPSMKSYLKSFSSTIQTNNSIQNQLEVLKKKSKRKSVSFKRVKQFVLGNRNVRNDIDSKASNRQSLANTTSPSDCSPRPKIRFFQKKKNLSSCIIS